MSEASTAKDRLIAYVHLHGGATHQTQAELEGHARAFALREGHELCRLLVGAEGFSSVTILGDLVDSVREIGTDCVLVVGPARQVLVALPRLCNATMLTLASVRPPLRPAERSR